MPFRSLGLASCLLFGMNALVQGQEPVHRQVDALILAAAKGKPASPPADDAEFLRRIMLDLAGRIPTLAEVREFLADKGADKRTRKIDALLAAPTYGERMTEIFHIMFMERLGENADWAKYLQTSFSANKPWDAMAREILRADPENAAARGAAFFYSKRLENYGQNPVDYAALTRDVGRLFLGKDFRCAQCHDHLFIKDYKQEDFQGLYAFFKNTALQSGAKSPTVAEKPTTEKVAFMSVFKKVPRQVGPRVPGMEEMPIPPQEKGKEFAKPADPKTGFPGQLAFSPLAKLAEKLPSADNKDFSRNMVNRLWWVLMGRGLVHPLDLHHDGNQPSHPQVLELMAKEFVAHKFDMKWLVRELALTQVYQRSSVLPEGQDKLATETFLTALEKRLSAEQVLTSVLTATGAKPAKPADAKARFLKAFANPAREPEDEIAPSLKGALFILNDGEVLSWLVPKPGNLIDRLSKLADTEVADELYLSVLSRLPSNDEKADTLDHLKKNAARRPSALGHLAWALLACTEFSVNH